MKVPAIKKLVENFKTEELEQAEETLLEEKQPDIEVDGEDEGEQLTHVLAAKFIIDDMHANGTQFKEALRKYTDKVRTSIS